jgi:hypothetical protein
MTENNHQTHFLIDNFNDPPRPPVATPPATFLRRLTAGQEGDPSSRKALLWMTAKGGFGGRTGRLGEADRLAGRATRAKTGGLKTAATTATATSTATATTTTTPTATSKTTSASTATSTGPPEGGRYMGRLRLVVGGWRLEAFVYFDFFGVGLDADAVLFSDHAGAGEGEVVIAGG